MFLGRHVGGAFDFDEGGPGGWWILVEPGIELPRAPEVAPDLGGWRRERMPAPPDEGKAITLAPDADAGRALYAQGFQGLIVAPTGLLVAACRDFLERIGRS